MDGGEGVTDSELYRAFGDQVASTGNTRNPYRFQGQGGPYTDAVNRVWMRARSYDPGTGQWYSTDPIGFAGEDWNLYRFVENNPINVIDPSGRQSVRSRYGPIEVVGNNWNDVYIVIQALKSVFNTRIGQISKNIIINDKISVKIAISNKGCNSSDTIRTRNSDTFESAAIHLDLMHRPIVKTVDGNIIMKVDEIIAHELGHIVSGLGDTAQFTDDVQGPIVRYYENAFRKEKCRPQRTAY